MLHFKKDMEYRIKEHANIFTIYVFSVYTTGFWWWKKEVKDWIRASMWGNDDYDWYYGDSTRQEHFTDLKSAQDKVKSWKQTAENKKEIKRLKKLKPIIHECI